jgi:hypothetical protein
MGLGCGVPFGFVGDIMARLTQTLEGIARCPHCGIANPQLVLRWHSQDHTPHAIGPGNMWAAYCCTRCGGVVTAKGANNDGSNNAEIIAVFPAAKEAHADIPEPARTFLQQAYETLHAPDAAAVMAGSAVDAMLKALGYKKGSLYDRIDEAVKDQKLTSSMGDWAHEVRLGSNRPRHSDENEPHVLPEQAAQSVEFAEALGYFLFVLTKRVESGLAAAKQAKQ